MTRLFGAAIFSEGERDLPLELFLRGSRRVLEETSLMEVTLSYITGSGSFPFVQCSDVVYSLPVHTGRGTLLKFMNGERC